MSPGRIGWISGMYMIMGVEIRSDAFCMKAILSHSWLKTSNSPPKKAISLVNTHTHGDTIRSRLKELYRNVAVCVHVGCVHSNISWNWFLAPYLSAVVRAFPLAQAPHMHALLLQPHPFKYVQSIATKELLAHTEPEEINMPHAYLVAFDYAVSF